MMKLRCKQTQTATAHSWPHVRLGEVCQIVPGRHIVELDHNRAKRGVPYLTGPSDFGELQATPSRWTEKPDAMCQPHDVLVTVKGAGVANLNFAPDEPTCIGRQLMAVRAKAGVTDSGFVYHALGWLNQRLKEQAMGATVPGLSIEHLANLRFELPPLAEQRRIAGRLREQLAAVAQARAAVQAQLDAAQVLPAAHLRAVFQSAAAQRWPHRRLGDAAEIVGGMQKTPDRAPRQFHKQFLTVRNVQHGRLDLSNVERFEVTETEFARLRLLKGDLLLVEGNGSQSHIGRNALFNEDGDWIHQNHIIRARLNRSMLLAEFVSHYLNSTAGRGQLLEKAKTTTGLYTLSTGKIATLEIPTPALDTQRQIAARLDAEKQEAASLTKMLTEKLTALDHLPAALLREAFKGGS